MTIPSLQNDELPPGEYQASLAEIETIYGCANDRRKLLMRGLHEAVQSFTVAGVKTYG